MNEIKEFIDSYDLTKPFAETLLRKMTREELEYLQRKTFDRISELITPDAMAFKDLGLTQNYDDFKLEFANNYVLQISSISYKGIQVFSDYGNFATPGVWITELRKFANRQREDSKREAEAQANNDRENIIRRFLGQPLIGKNNEDSPF